MKICLFGATGRVGNDILRLALQDGHEVRALVRKAESLLKHPKIEMEIGNAREYEDVKKVMEGCDVIISALGTDGTTTLSESIPHMLREMRPNQRIITIGTAGILQARSNPTIYRFQSSESRRKSTRAAYEHVSMYEALQRSNVNWTIVCPTHLIDGVATGIYRVEKDVLPVDGMTITVGDTAQFAYKQLHSSLYEKARVGIAY